MAFLLTAVGAALAVALELLEALAIVVAVGASRGWRDAVVGALGGAAACALVAALLGPVVLAGLPVDVLRGTIGALLLLFGLEWLRKATLRLAGRKARSSARAEYLEAREEASEAPRPADGRADWAARAIAFKGVLLEGVEVVLIVSVLASRPAGATAALVGAGVALVLVAAFGALLAGPLRDLPETELKWVVGVLLCAFGTFFLGEGLAVGWPGGEAAVLYVAAALAATSWACARALARERPAATAVGAAS